MTASRHEAMTEGRHDAMVALEIWVHIASLSLDAYHRLVRAMPEVARYFSTRRSLVISMFVDAITYHPARFRSATVTDTYVLHRGLDVRHSVFGEPARIKKRTVISEAVISETLPVLNAGELPRISYVVTIRYYMRWGDVIRKDTTIENIASYDPLDRHLPWTVGSFDGKVEMILETASILSICSQPSGTIAALDLRGRPLMQGCLGYYCHLLGFMLPQFCDYPFLYPGRHAIATQNYNTFFVKYGCGGIEKESCLQSVPAIEEGKIVEYPAVVTRMGTKIWYSMNRIHREGDSPAVEMADGTKMWVTKGFMCRRSKNGESQPAVTIPGKGCLYFKNGLLHNQRGHSVSIPNHYAWHVDGIRL